MHIAMNGTVLLEEHAESYDDLTEAYKKSETSRGREVPLFALEVFLIAVALWFLERAAEKAFDLAVDSTLNVKKEAESREFHEALRKHLAAMKEMLEEAGMLAREGQDIGAAARQLPGPPTPLTVTVGDGPDVDLIQAFEVIAQKLPELGITLSRQAKRNTAPQASTGDSQRQK